MSAYYKPQQISDAIEASKIRPLISKEIDILRTETMQIERRMHSFRRELELNQGTELQIPLEKVIKAKLIILENLNTIIEWQSSH